MAIMGLEQMLEAPEAESIGCLISKEYELVKQINECVRSTKWLKAQAEYCEAIIEKDTGAVWLQGHMIDKYSAEIMQNIKLHLQMTTKLTATREQIKSLLGGCKCHVKEKVV